MDIVSAVVVRLPFQTAFRQTLLNVSYDDLVVTIVEGTRRTIQDQAPKSGSCSTSTTHRAYANFTGVVARARSKHRRTHGTTTVSWQRFFSDERISEVLAGSILA